MNKFKKPNTANTVSWNPPKKIEKTVTFCNHCQFMKVYRENKPDTCNWLMVCDFTDEFGRTPEGNPFILRKWQDKNFGMNPIPSNCPLEDLVKECDHKHKKRPKPPKPEEPDEPTETGIKFDIYILATLGVEFDDDSELEVINIESKVAVFFNDEDGVFEFVEPTSFTFETITTLDGVEQYHTLVALLKDEWVFEIA